MRESLADYCKYRVKRELLADWDVMYHLPPTPDTASYDRFGDSTPKNTRSVRR